MILPRGPLRIRSSAVRFPMSISSLHKNQMRRCALLRSNAQRGERSMRPVQGRVAQILHKTCSHTYPADLSQRQEQDRFRDTHVLRQERILDNPNFRVNIKLVPTPPCTTLSSRHASETRLPLLLRSTRPLCTRSAIFVGKADALLYHVCKGVRKRI